jgi:hypothetical protein
MLTNYMPDCGLLNVGGLEVGIYFTCTSELANVPRTKKKLGVTPSLLGHKNLIGEAYSFAGAQVGEGYWRKLESIDETGMMDFSISEKDGTVKIENKIQFSTKGLNEIDKEFAENVASCCAMSFIVIDRAGVAHEIGTKRNPAKVVKIDGSTGGDFRGLKYELSAYGMVPRTIDLDEFPLDTTPN